MRRRETKLGIIVILAITAIAIVAGCVGEEKISARDDINMSLTLANSGASRIENINWESGEYSHSDAKAKLTASKADYEEALKILNNATTEYDEEKNIIGVNKIICNYSLDNIAALQNFVVCSEHLDKAVAYIEWDDIESIRTELMLAEDALNNSLPFISAAKEKCYSIDVDTVPIESKSRFLEDRIELDQTEKIIPEYGKIVSGLYPLVDGMEHLLKAIDYMNKEEWHNAELEFGKSSPDFLNCKDIFVNLKNSEFTEVSVMAIEIEGVLTKMLEALPHFEAGCRYASKGNFEKAEEEFNKVSGF